MQNQLPGRIKWTDQAQYLLNYSKNDTGENRIHFRFEMK